MLREISAGEALNLAFTGVVNVFRQHDTADFHGYEVKPLSKFGTIDEIMKATQQGGYKFVIEEDENAGKQSYEDRIPAFTRM